MAEEAGRMHARGYHDGLAGGTLIGLPTVLNFGKPALKAKIIPEALAGKKHVCLCISEAFAGSDVAGLKTFASKSADGTYYTVTGTKKWITGGTIADYVCPSLPACLFFPLSSWSVCCGLPHREGNGYALDRAR